MKRLMPLIICLLLLSQMAILSSCKKDTKGAQAGTPTPTSFSKIKTMTDSINSYTETYTYNSAGKITKMVESDGYHFDILYATNQVTINGYYDSTGTLEFTEVFTLNSSGLATMVIVTSSNKSKMVNKYFSFLKKSIIKSSSIDTVKYEYDVNGYLIKETYISNGNSSVTTYTYTNGNKTFESNSNGDNHTYDYYTDKINTIGIENEGISFLGKQDKNLVKTETITYPGQTYINNYLYTYDSKGRVAKQREIQNGYTNGVSIYTYTE